ncbi:MULTISPECIES: phage major tail protein, TP901-1 family [Enterococcus]|uniref:phage major tail protein, TP901-1 family n=1 Tax=Enterococcus TaxID=1350 RepID=UPI0011CB51BE|nr:phage major tail protein, TP901-1 family [Enterococcus gallinarum]
MAEAKKGIDLILLYRVKSKAEQEAAWKLAFQTEHENSKSRSADTTVTKDGGIITLGEIEYTLTGTSIAAKGDAHIDELDDAFDDGEVIEVWEIDKAEKGTGENADKYKAKYAQAYLTSFGQSAGAEDSVELSLEFGVFGRQQKGYATLTDEQAEVVQYVFTDTVQATPAG